VNLIEQLGRYEDAKTKRDQINSTLENSELLGGGDAKEGLYERLESIEQALLEYRRQHNIFEVGDYFCYESKYLSNDPLDGDAYKKLNQLDSIDFECGFVESALKRGGIIRHATDAEIKAGKRLEVKSEN
jgi:hypothetical protein